MSASRRRLLGCLVATVALLLPDRFRGLPSGRDDLVLVDGWLLRRSDLDPPL